MMTNTKRRAMEADIPALEAAVKAAEDEAAPEVARLQSILDGNKAERDNIRGAVCARRMLIAREQDLAAPDFDGSVGAGYIRPSKTLADALVAFAGVSPEEHEANPYALKRRDNSLILDAAHVVIRRAFEQDATLAGLLARSAKLYTADREIETKIRVAKSKVTLRERELAGLLQDIRMREHNAANKTAKGENPNTKYAPARKKLDAVIRSEVIFTWPPKGTP